MAYDSKLVTEKINKWDSYLNDFNLPSWDSLPTIGLYMDQIVTLMNEYLGIFPIVEGKNNTDVITASTINNYVRLEIMPAPIKKKYMRTHIAYLIIICTLKISLSISEIGNLIPSNLSDEKMQQFYTHYINIYRDSSLDFAKRVMGKINEIKEENEQDFITDLISQAAIESTFSKMFFNKMTRLNNVSYKEASDTYKK